MDYILIIIGFVLLIKGADFLVDGASSIARKFQVSGLIIGLTIVAFWTSAPELIVNILSGFSGNTDLAVSNILGSNISNIFLILGCTALFYPIAIPGSAVRKEIPFLIFTSLLLGIVLWDKEISRIDAGVLGIFFLCFLYYAFISGKKNKEISPDIPEKTFSNFLSFLYIIWGLAGLLYGGHLIVGSAVSIAENFWLPKSFIGLTIVAIGTSLPELAASITAAMKKKTDMAIGAIVGSNIFNSLWILGATGLIQPLKSYPDVMHDVYIDIIASVLILVFAFTRKKYFINRPEGILLLVLYVSYITFTYVNL